ncbi:AI-2E family transporter [Tianweitania sp. BSSL-BM11]|uniref:AI-2E family transporter n=1 Tax=Tianweitania aestuarii TaxID=2814886 RepID=A0ABS5RZN8_9HYPH|nr:AI-2E family transporter [Tianweitania aestuarii]MBS9722526.1 AI-2E family transporter [Tianweitania aestuarii]
MNRTIKRAPIVRLPPRSNTEIVIARSAQVAMIIVGVLAVIAALYAGKFILAPIFLGVTIGLMLGPVATRVERYAVSSSLTGVIVVLIFLALLSGLVFAVAAPLSFWVERIPAMFSDLRLRLTEFQGPIETIRTMREQLRSVTGGSESLPVSVDDDSAVASLAILAPSVFAQILLFFASLYFFIATRHETRKAILQLCIRRRLRWRVAHIFRDIERLVSRYLLSIALINIAHGAAVVVAMWVLDVPSPILWGAIAALFNFVPYLGPALTAVILFAVGLAEFDTFTASLLPVIIYLAIHLIEAQFVTPMVIGRAMTLNPFAVLIALAFWIWLWGPIGGFIAIPGLLILYAVVWNLIPGIAADNAVSRSDDHVL